MGISVTRKTVIGLVCLCLFSTCGDLDLETMIPSNKTYMVRTLVNGSSLEECSILRLNDTIRPYFAGSVVNDPDLIGLLVYLQDSQGQIIGETVQYSLLPYAGENAITETPAEESESEESGRDETDNADITDDDTELPGYQIREQWSFTDTKLAERNSDIEIAVKSFSQELPYFSLPKELEIGPYILVFEALSKKEILSRMETNVFYIGSAEFTLKDISMYLPGLSGQQLISPGTVVMLDTSLAFDRLLDPYVIWYNGKNIISEGRISDGAGKILWKAPEQAGFYSLRMEVFPFRLNRTVYTGISREITLPISPKAISLGFFFDQHYTARTPLSAGTAYPETLNEDVSYPAPELRQWYQFDGSLHSTISTFTKEQTIQSTRESPPRWMSVGQSYGLSVKQNDPYLLSPVNFFREKDKQGGGIFLLHIRPLSEGTIFNVFFPLESSVSEGVWMEMITKGNVLSLRLSASDTFVDLPVYRTPSSAEKLLPIAVEFYIRPSRLEAKISLDGYSQNRIGVLKLPGPLSGEGRIRLGGEMDKIPEKEAAFAVVIPSADEAYYEMPTDTVSAIPDSAGEINAYIPADVDMFTDTIWDELAILFSAVPLLPEELDTGADYNVNTRPVVESNDADTMSVEDGDAGNPALAIFTDKF